MAAVGANSAPQAYRSLHWYHHHKSFLPYSGAMNLDLSFSPQVYLNLNVRGLQHSATIAINERCAELRRQGRDVVRLGLGQSPFPVPDIMVRALRDSAHEKDYLPVKGLPALRDAIVGYYRRTEGLNYRPEHVLVGPGTKELMFLVQLVYYGDLVIPAPSWVSYAPQAQIIGRHLRWLPTQIETGLGVTPEALERLCESDPGRPRLLILNYPGNPTGAVYTTAQLQRIADVARKYRVLLLADEIYSGLNFEGRHVSISRFYPEGTIISNGLSKWAGAGGWRLGAFVFPPTLAWLVDTMAAVASETFTATAAPIQHAAIPAFEDGTEMQHYLKCARRVLSALMRHSYERLRDAGAILAEPKGGFYVFPNLTPLSAAFSRVGVTTSQALCEWALEEAGVAFLPGTAFGRPPTELSARIACVDFDGAGALAAAARLADAEQPDDAFLRRYCAPTMDGLERLCAKLAML
jgi:aspartate aminotransferase